MIVWLPPVRLDVEHVAWPPPLSVPSPTPVQVIAVPPSLNVTVPVGVPVPGPLMLTVAVNVTACPYVDGFTDELTVVAVAILFTVIEPFP